MAEHTEVESGTVNARPELVRALAACRIHGATLVVAKLDRLSRDAAFLLNLKASGVRFVIAEMPEANELTVDLLAVLAQHERRVISERTKAALAVAKRRGVRLGNPSHLDRKARWKGRPRVRRPGARWHNSAPWTSRRLCPTCGAMALPRCATSLMGSTHAASPHRAARSGLRCRSSDSFRA